ncbi:hypothetical protein [Synechococcus elongatus]|uniref:hypothetical protein n=2 Tax=Synechococcus elongatus TaxID=32046 RepID=UPI0030CA5BFF
MLSLAKYEASFLWPENKNQLWLCPGPSFSEEDPMEQAFGNLYEIFGRQLVRLKDQPEDMPDFVLEYCQGDRCWVRQQAWGRTINLGIQRSQIIGLD